jgi:dTMP kinase
MTSLTIPNGLLVAIEGIDGAGKTTLAHRLGAMLNAAGITTQVSKEPTTGPWGMKMRESAAAGRLDADDELRYLLLDRQAHVAELIAPALARGELVILDRYYPSTVAYQGAAGLDVHALLDANAFAPKPDLLLVLDLEPAVGLARIRARGDKPNHFENTDNLTRCREIFTRPDLLQATVIDASASADQVFAQALRYIKVSLKARLGDDTHARDVLAELHG